LGQVTHLTEDARFASVALGGEAKNVEDGIIVAIINKADTVGAGMIIHKGPTQAILHLPPCWREGGISVGANVQYIQDVATNEE
jgi:hypothetical protein